MDIKIKSPSDGNTADITIDTSAWLMDEQEKAKVIATIKDELRPAFERIFESRKVLVEVGR